MMRQLNLQEYQPSEPQILTAAELRQLQATELHLSITPTGDAESEYTLTPSSTVGAVELDGLSVLIEPKIGVPRLLSLACYAIGKVKLLPQYSDFPDMDSLPDILAAALYSHARRAFSRGLLHGYITVEEGLHTVRGRIRFDEQIRRRFGTSLPVEVRYDEFTDDIPANRLIKAAAYRLSRMSLVSSKARAGLAWIAAMLYDVSLQEFAPTQVPKVNFDRINEHYRGVIAISRLILRHDTYEARRGQAIRAPGFLMDMNVVFQEFVTVALREKLGVTERVFGETSIPTLDEGGRVSLIPDLVWREGSVCRFVGDAKYKHTNEIGRPNDLYQLLAYTTALDLPGGMLIYAKGEGEPTVHTIRHSGKHLEVVALDLEKDLDAVLDQVELLAQRIRSFRDKAARL